ncbi:conserved hypothetical protein [uncultured Desulfatiglans sp.]|nr:conserved hypothetical protein [uncultured Desulfatiglans sp.]
MPFNKEYISLPFDETGFRERNRDLSLLLDLSFLAASTIDLAGLLSRSIAKITSHFQLDAARIYLMDEKAECMHLAASLGIETEHLEIVRLEEGFSGKSARTRSFIAQRLSELDDRERIKLLAARGIKIIICVPLILMDKVVGVLNLAARHEVELHQGMVDILNLIGSQIAVAVTNIRLLEDIRSKAEEIEKKNETIKFFAYSISHDLKGPAIAIYGLLRRLESMIDGGLDEKAKTCLEHIFKASTQLQRLVADINAYISAKEASLDIEKVPVKEVLAEIQESLREILSCRGIAWIVPEDLPVVSADRLSLGRVLRNLTENALKYGGPGMTEIRFGYRDEGDFHVFSVSDNGVGISREDASHLFELFRRHASSKGTEGSGMGLAIVKEIIQRHEGRVWLAEGEGSGASFVFSIRKGLG